MKDILNEIPKVELHCHLDGSVRPETMYEILRENEDIDLKNMSFEEFLPMTRVGRDNDSLVEYLKKFDYPARVMQTEKNLSRVAYELLEDLDRSNVIYAEIRFAPSLHMEKGLTFDQVLGAVISGMDRAMEEFDILANLILIGMRNDGGELTLDMVEKGRKYLGRGVVAVDIAGNERDFPPEIHKEAFKRAKDLGYGITIHAGETGSSKNIRTSINDLYASRIGHGIAAIKDGGLMYDLVDKGIFLELCPISNIQTKAVDGIGNYPIRKFMDRGIKITINTDNLTVSDSSLVQEYLFLMENFKLDLGDIFRFIENSIDGAFICGDEKKILRMKLENYKKCL